MSKELNESIGKRIRAYREVQKMTREEFAEKTGLSPQFVAELENGRKGLSAVSLFKICQACNFSADYLLMGNEKTYGTTNPLQQLVEEVPAEYEIAYVKVLNCLNDVIKKNN